MNGGGVNVTIAPARPLSSTTFTCITCVYFFGVLGNAGALYYLLRPKTRPRNPRHAFLLTILAANDFTAMVGMWIQMNIFYLDQTTAYSRSHIFCVVRVIWRAFGLGSGCIVCVMAIERWIALTRPFCYHKHVTLSFIRKCTLFLWLINLLIVCMPLFGFGVYYDRVASRCVRYKQAKEPIDIAYAYFYLSFGLTLCICLVGCNMLVVRNLTSKGSAKSRGAHQVLVRRISRNRDLCTSSSKEENAFARVMGLLCIVFIIFWLPQFASIPISLIYSGKPFVNLYMKLADGIMALHFVLDPYLYILQRCRLFRPSKWCRKPSSRINSVKTSNEMCSL